MLPGGLEWGLRIVSPLVHGCVVRIQKRWDPPVTETVHHGKGKRREQQRGGPERPVERLRTARAISVRSRKPLSLPPLPEPSRMCSNPPRAWFVRGCSVNLGCFHLFAMGFHGWVASVVAALRF
ncbi:hypothetical protein PR202_gb09185 [Eleusine coracana subsp. coracana]|uniref:Uncharacterized protein n=1 Tax=Eleusine coracana subsp. coracana TaxID=191504 RepID=A0AAV5EH53_ELECO|nr:hypothetical protein PR202_gb09185 [Eleusine coracana subsp. coracana]